MNIYFNRLPIKMDGITHHEHNTNIVFSGGFFQLNDIFFNNMFDNKFTNVPAVPVSQIEPFEPSERSSN